MHLPRESFFAALPNGERKNARRVEILSRFPLLRKGRTSQRQGKWAMEFERLFANDFATERVRFAEQLHRAARELINSRYSQLRALNFSRFCLPPLHSRLRGRNKPNEPPRPRDQEERKQRRVRGSTVDLVLTWKIAPILAVATPPFARLLLPLFLGC